MIRTTDADVMPRVERSKLLLNPESKTPISEKVLPSELTKTDAGSRNALQLPQTVKSEPGRFRPETC